MTEGDKTITQSEVEPEGDKAVGLTVAKWFDTVKFYGTVDKVRTERRRHYYHVTYTDGDEEEMTQTELRAGYVLGLADKQNIADGTEADKTDQGDDEASAGEGSVCDASSEEESLRRSRKKRRKEQVVTRVKTKKNDKLSGHRLPQPGDKNVASEAFGKLTVEEQQTCAANIDRKTKKVS